MRIKRTGKLTACVLALAIMSSVLTGCGGKSAADYNEQGMTFYEQGDFDQALSYLEKATSMDEDNVTYKQNYAMVLIQEGRQDEAIEILESTITKKKKGAEGTRNKYAYRALGLAYLNKHEYETAIEKFNKALKLDVAEEWNTDIKYYKGNAQQLLGDTEAALDTYTDILKTDSENALAYEARAGIYRNNGEYEKAINDFNKALSYDDGSFEIYIGLAACCLETGDQAGADDALFLASMLDIETNEDKFYLGVVHYYQGKFDQAQPEMEYALANGIEEANFYLAELCMMNGDYETAMTYFATYANSTVVESPTVCNDLAVCYMKSEEYDAAYEWIEKGLTFMSSTVRQELLRNEIACLEGMGDLSGAHTKLAEYITAYPEDTAAATEYNWLDARVN